MEFPHLKGSTAYPGSNIDVYRYRNEFDYSLWEANTVIKVMQTRLDSGYENVGGWESVEERDRYFDRLQGETVTLSSALHLLPDGSIKLPLPPSVMATYNYIMITLPVAPVSYEQEARVARFFFFVTDIIQRAENATQCVLQLDEWTTYAPRAEFAYMHLERGHMPLSEIDADTYLTNPLEHNDLLLAPDVNLGALKVARSSSEAIINQGDNWACFATAANPRADWGSYDAETLNTPATTSVTLQQGQPSVDVVAVDAANLGRFLINVEAYAPQFKRSVLAMFLVPKRLVEVASTYTFAGTTCHSLTAQQTTIPLDRLTRSSFGYPQRYADLAKLYTYPYAVIEVSDGISTQEIRVEDTNGALKLETTVNLAWPFLTFDSFLSGAGGSNRKSVTFTNLDTRSITIGGTWYDTLKSWAIPTFAVVQSGADTVDYATYYDRLQAEYSAATAETNAGNSAAAATSNAALAAGAASANTGVANTTASTVTNIGNSTSQALQAWDAGLSRDTTAISNDAVAATTATNAVGNIVGGFMSGGPMGAAGAVMSGVTSGITAAITITSNTALAEATISNSQAKVTSQNNSNTSIQGYQATANTSITTNNNGVITGSAANNASAMTTNAGNTHTVATKGIERSVKTAGLESPNMFGNWAAGENATSRPLGIFATVVTQPDYAIRAAGDAFLRYGYNLNQAVTPTTLNVMRHFSYWKSADTWITGEGITAGARAALRAILSAGTTVWRNIDNIGEVSIYGNNK